MSLSATAQRIYDHLPEDGSKVGGISLQRDLEISKLTYQKGRDELKEQGLVVSGKGRGGSLARVEGKKLEEVKAPTKEERMAHAREAKVAQSRAKRESDELMEKILVYIHESGYTQVERKDISFSDGRPVFAVWADREDGHSYAKMYGIPQLEYDKLRATGGLT